MTGKSKIMIRILLIFICAMVVLALGFLFRQVVIPQTLLADSPKQVAQVEAVAKRIRERHENAGPISGESIYRYCYITFKFPDGSEKEFYIGMSSSGDTGVQSDSTAVYNSIREGDMGVLTYKATKNFADFISFEPN